MLHGLEMLINGYEMQERNEFLPEKNHLFELLYHFHEDDIILDFDMFEL